MDNSVSGLIYFRSAWPGRPERLSYGCPLAADTLHLTTMRCAPSLNSMASDSRPVRGLPLASCLKRLWQRSARKGQNGAPAATAAHLEAERLTKSAGMEHRFGTVSLRYMQ